MLDCPHHNPQSNLFHFEPFANPTISYLAPPSQLMPNNVLAIVNATGRQAASVARVGAAVGYDIRAHVSKTTLPVAQELASLQNVTVFEGSIEDKDLIAKLFAGAHKAFINTFTWGDEVAIGKSLADAAKKANIKHYIYSSMPDHSIYGKGWPAAPLWASKFTIENYVRQVCPADIASQGDPVLIGRIDWFACDFCLYRHLQQ